MTNKTLWIIGGIVLLALIALALWASKKSNGDPIDIIGTQEEPPTTTGTIIPPGKGDYIASGGNNPVTVMNGNTIGIVG